MWTSIRYIYFPVVISALFVGCAKSGADSKTSPKTATSPALYSTDPQLSPFYGDSVLYIKGNNAAAYQAKPVNSPGVGTYVAWPSGITINPQTGVIDLLHSEPGSRYNIGFVSAATNDTVYSQVVLAGASYPDGVYTLDGADSLLQPYYNAQQASAVPCSGNECQFNGNGFLLGGIDDQQVSIGLNNGNINLKESIQNGLFGRNPQNGATKVITVNYRLNDGSGRNLQSTSLVLHYYYTLADVPADLLSVVRQASASTAGPVTTDNSAGNLMTDASTPGSKIVVVVAPPKPTPARPPQVVIVVKGH